MSSKTSPAGQHASLAARSFLPWHGTAFAIFFFASLLFGCPYLLLRDGGTARHIYIGLHVIQNHIFPQTNFTWAVNPNYHWITSELGNYVVFGFVYQWLQLNGIILLTAIPLTLALMWSIQLGRVKGLGPLSVWIAFIPALLSTSLHWTARPLVFGYIGFLAFYYLSTMSTASARWRTLVAAIIGCLWINLHGSALFGVSLLLIRPVQLLYDFLRHRRGRWNDFLLELVPPLGAAVGICVNPIGTGFYTFLFNYLIHPHVVLQVTEYRGAEWGPFDISITPGSWAFLVLIFLVLIVFAIAKYRPPFAEGMYFVFLALAGFYAMRLVPYFGLLSLAFMGPAWRKLMNESSSAKFTSSGGIPLISPCLRLLKICLRAFLRIELLIEGKESQSISNTFLILVALLVSTIIGAFLYLPSFKIKDFCDTALPVASVTYLSEHAPDKLGLVIDNWSPYLYLRLHRPVFIDDKVDSYPPEFVQEYIDTLAAKPGWEKTLNKYSLVYLLLPKSCHLADAVKSSPDWVQVFSDNVSLLFFRKQ